MAVTDTPEQPQPVAADAFDPQPTAQDMFVKLGKDAAYAKAAENSTVPLIRLRQALFWQDVASLIDAMSPCEICGKPGERHFNDVFACSDCGERIERDPAADRADDAYSERNL